MSPAAQYLTPTLIFPLLHALQAGIAAYLSSSHSDPDLFQRPIYPYHSGADSRNCSRSTRLSAFPVGFRGIAAVKCTRLGSL